MSHPAWVADVVRDAVEAVAEAAAGPGEPSATTSPPIAYCACRFVLKQNVSASDQPCASPVVCK